MERLTQYATLLTEEDAPFRKAIDRFGVEKGVPKNGFKNLQEFEDWRSCGELKDKMFYGKFIVELTALTCEFCNEDDSFSETVMHYLFNRKLMVPVSAATILVDQRNQKLAIVIHGKTNFNNDIKKRAWPIIKRRGLRDMLPEDVSPVPTIEFDKGAGELAIVIPHRKTSLEMVAKAWSEIEKGELRSFLPDFKSKKFQPRRSLNLQRDSYQLHKKTTDNDLAYYWSPPDADKKQINPTSVAVWRKRHKDDLGIVGNP